MKEDKENLLKSLDYLEKKLKGTKDQVESAIISDKIKDLKNKLSVLAIVLPDSKVKDVIDQPVVADRSTYNPLVLTRGQVLDTETFSSIII